MKIAPKPRVAAGTGVLVLDVGRLNDRLIVFSLAVANVLGGLKAGNNPATLALTSVNPSPLTA